MFRTFQSNKTRAVDNFEHARNVLLLREVAHCILQLVAVFVVPHSKYHSPKTSLFFLTERNFSHQICVCQNELIRTYSSNEAVGLSYFSHSKFWKEEFQVWKHALSTTSSIARSRRRFHLGLQIVGQEGGPVWYSSWTSLTTQDKIFE